MRRCDHCKYFADLEFVKLSRRNYPILNGKCMAKKNRNDMNEGMAVNNMMKACYYFFTSGKMAGQEFQRRKA